METPITMRINDDCELSGCELPEAILSVLERCDEMFKYMREVHQTLRRFVRITAKAKSDLIHWSRRNLDYRPSALLWRGLPIIGPHDKPPSRQSAAA